MKTFHYLKEGFEEETRKCRNSSCSRNGRIHIVKMIVLPNTIDQYSAILIKIPTPFLTEIGKNLKIHTEQQKTLEIKGNPEKNNHAREITIPDLKICYRTLVIKKKSDTNIKTEETILSAVN